MKTRKIISLGVFFLALVSLLFISSLFIIHYIKYGLNADSDSLFHLLTQIDYVYLSSTFLAVMLFMVILDVLLLSIQFFWRDFNSATPLSFRLYFLHSWRHHRTIHLTFILLTIFLTIVITTPSKVMNTFTAIVSISVLVSNLTKD
ncbi:hypothetical protein UCCLB556_1960 [Levilactobacillus brevis]|nr:hypothetical protein UCCLB556_1960 [Levilactobacillus brevis]